VNIGRKQFRVQCTVKPNRNADNSTSWR